MSKKIVVFLATGDQGSSVCRYLLQDGGYDVVGITRSTDSDKAKELAKLGVKVVKGDMSDPSSYKTDIAGLYGAFVNADFWNRYFGSGLNEDVAYQAENGDSKGAIEACVEAGVKHIVYSTLDDVPKERPCPHFASKAAITRYIKEKGYPATQLYTSTYISNCVKFGQLEKKGDGSYTFGMPAPDNIILPQFAVEQTGGWVLAAFNQPDKYIGQSIYAASEITTLAEMTRVLAECSGQKIDSLHMTEDQFLGSGKAELEKKITPELWKQYFMFWHKDMHRDVEESRKVYPGQWDTRAWCENVDEFKAVFRK